MQYVDDFLPIIRAYCEEHGVDSTERETDELNTSELAIDSVENETEEPNTCESASEESNTYALELFEQLQDKCRIVAKREQRRIFNERTLKEMATFFPQTEESFIKIHGVGPKKTERYAKVFLPIIQDYCEKHGIDPTKGVTEKLNTHESASEEPNEYASELFEQLRTTRKTVADEEGVRAFVVFWDKTLKEMATFFPQTKEEFMQIHHVTPAKSDKYADIFLPIICDYCKEHGILERS